MNKKKENKKIFLILATILLISLIFLPSVLSDFILPPEGGAMVHSDPQMSENIRLPVPIDNVSELWRRNNLMGEKRGTFFNGIAGNGKIAASTFECLLGKDNLILYDYYGNHLWSSGIGKEGSLKATAMFSTPMIDINNSVIACDTSKIIMVNASDLDNIYIQWFNEFNDKLINFEFPLSPTIVENKIIILPTNNGPIYAFDVETGDEYCSITLGNHTTIDPYYGIPYMTLENAINVMKDYRFYSKCPYRYNSTSQLVEWNSTVDYGIMPRLEISHFTFEDYDINFTAFKNGTVNAVERETEDILAWNLIENPGIYTGEGYFSTDNSACVKGNKVFITTKYKKSGIHPFFNNTIGRLYAINVTRDDENNTVDLEEYWNYTFFGSSQASPILINDTIFFDGYNNTLFVDDRDPHIYAVYTNGTERWNVSYDNMTWFSFAVDPRGGFWYEDAEQWFYRPAFKGGNKLVRFSEEDGSILDEINISELFGETVFLPLVPSSCMTICGSEENPIMLISANRRFGLPGKWCGAINLSDNNSLIWKFQVESPLLQNYIGGQYTILQENNISRILTSLMFPGGGVIGIGSYSNCWFEDFEYSFKDSDCDNNQEPDTVQVNFTLNSVLPERVWVKATLISKWHPILCRFKEDMHFYNVTGGVNGSINVTLPHRAPEGDYRLHVFLYNSSGEINRKILTIFDYFDIGIYANQTKFSDPTHFELYPPNDPPATPNNITGETSVSTGEWVTYQANTTDPNDDEIYYQWKYETRIGPWEFDYYTLWIRYGAHESGEFCSHTILWPFDGTYKVWVRAKDDILNPNVMSNWSNPLEVTVTDSSNNMAPWNSDLFGQFSETVVVVNQQTGCNGFAPGISVSDPQTRGSLNWTWDFGDGNISYGENIIHNYSQIGNYTVNLSLKYNDEYYNCSVNISVVPLKAECNITDFIQPDETIYFNDSSIGLYEIVNWTWDFGDGNISYEQNTSHIFNQSGEYTLNFTVMDSQNNTNTESIELYVESVPPKFVQVIDTLNPTGFGFNVTIYADLYDNKSGINSVWINITSPDNTSINHTMEENASCEYDYYYEFNNTWQSGVYNYSIWILDNSSNINGTSGFNFTVSGQANMSICTIKDMYGSDEFINITDPPGGDSFGGPVIGYELLDNDSVLRIWNKYDSYYFNTSSGVQLTNHYDEYWTHNVLMLGYYNNDQWNLLYRTDELTGFNKEVESDNETYVNATIWKDLSYGGYDFRLAIRYYLGVDDNELTVIPHIKNIDDQDINLVLGFGWELRDIQIDMTVTDDYIVVGNETYLLNQILDNTYTNLSYPIYCWNDSTNSTQICGYSDPAFYLMENISETTTESLYLRWDKDLTYKLCVKSCEGQYNAPTILYIKVGTLVIEQEKYTEMSWYDSSQVSSYFDNYNTGEAWSVNPDNMVDGSTKTFARASGSGDVELCNDTGFGSYPSGIISKVELRANGYSTTTGRALSIRPVFDGTSDGDNHVFSLPSEGADWSSWYDITDDTNSPAVWDWDDISDLDCDIEAYEGGGPFYCSKLEVRVTYTPNYEPEISLPSPEDNAVNVSISPTLSINVSDADGDTLKISWLSNSSGSWVEFGTNISGNGSCSQVMVNASVNGGWWYWKVNVSDGTVFTESDIYKFYTGVQSKIVNIGSTNISGYLLIQVQYSESTGQAGEWIVDNDTINETTPRTINIGEQLALDLIFNGLVSTDDLVNGDGCYRVYAAFRDPDGDVLVCDDESLLETWYEFEVDTV